MNNASFRSARKLAFKALTSTGLKTGATTVEWDIAGHCTAPIGREVWARDQTLLRGPIWVILKLRCRKCDNCRIARSMAWTNRAALECVKASRTWFGTFTLRPDEHDYVLHAARARALQKSEDFDAGSVGEQFSARCAVISRYFTLYLKRVRKVSGTRLRYLLVAEPHQSGLPHYHMLLHEMDTNATITYRQLSEAWPHGFTNFKLVTDIAQAKYICKYLSKTAAARVRASQFYGKTEQET